MAAKVPGWGMPISRKETEAATKDLRGAVVSEFKLGELEANCFRGIANMLGIMDLGGDVLAPGCFTASVLSAFLSRGFVPLGHDWYSAPVAMPTSAKEVPVGSMRGLEVEGEFHSTEAAQDVRTVVMERMARGQFCGLSIGFQCDRDSVEWYETGTALWKRLEEDGRTDSHDSKSIKAWKGYCRYVRKIADLYEVSIVTVPMNQASQITSAKSNTVSHPAGARAALTLDAHLDSVLAAVEELVVRVSGVADLRGAEGRSISEQRKAQLRGLAARLAELGKPSPRLADEAARLRCEADMYAALAGVQ